MSKNIVGCQSWGLLLAPSGWDQGSCFTLCDVQDRPHNKGYLTQDVSCAELRSLDLGQPIILQVKN